MDISPEIQAEDIINHCHLLSKGNQESGVTSQMTQASYDYVQCLKKHIINISDMFFLNAKSKEDFLRELHLYQTHSYAVYNLLHQGSCAPCGTMYSGLHINNTADHFENILTLMVFYLHENNRIPAH